MESETFLSCLRCCNFALAHCDRGIWSGNTPFPYFHFGFAEHSQHSSAFDTAVHGYWSLQPRHFARPDPSCGMEFLNRSCDSQQHVWNPRPPTRPGIKQSSASVVRFLVRSPIPRRTWALALRFALTEGGLKFACTELLAFFTPYDVSAFTPTPTSSTSDPTSGITVTRIEATLPIAPHGCQTNTVIEVSNGTWSADLTLNQSYNDSGQLNLESPVSTKVTLKVKIPAHCSGGGVIPPAAANIVVQYAVTPATS